jgi:hypothetical protein
MSIPRTFALAAIMCTTIASPSFAQYHCVVNPPQVGSSQMGGFGYAAIVYREKLLGRGRRSYDRQRYLYSQIPVSVLCQEQDGHGLWWAHLERQAYNPRDFVRAETITGCRELPWGWRLPLCPPARRAGYLPHQ